MAGKGNIVYPLIGSGRFVVASDIHDYGEGFRVLDYFAAPRLLGIEGLVTNPAYKKAEVALKKALGEYPYVALLIRTNFLMEGLRRARWLDQHEPTRVWLPCPRFPMMHRYGWAGKQAGSNTPHCWAIWQQGAAREFPQRFYWRELLGMQTPGRSRRKAA
jgi:hypothetical protein